MQPRVVLWTSPCSVAELRALVGHPRHADRADTTPNKHASQLPLSLYTRSTVLCCFLLSAVIFCFFSRRRKQAGGPSALFDVFAVACVHCSFDKHTTSLLCSNLNSVKCKESHETKRALRLIFACMAMDRLTSGYCDSTPSKSSFDSTSTSQKVMARTDAVRFCSNMTATSPTASRSTGETVSGIGCRTHAQPLSSGQRDPTGKTSLSARQHAQFLPLGGPARRARRSSRARSTPCGRCRVD